jgi:hypothetical protein
VAAREMHGSMSAVTHFETNMMFDFFPVVNQLILAQSVALVVSFERGKPSMYLISSAGISAIVEC